MKKILLLISCMLMIISLQAQEEITIRDAGDTFNPANVTVSPGTIVKFDVGDFHPVLQVSQATWNANGTTPLPGGFSFPNGTGEFQTTTLGTIYYVCTSHVFHGMKGTINVADVTAIEYIQDNVNHNFYPFPADKFITYFTKSLLPITEIRILDITAREVITVHNPVLSGGQTTIDIEHLGTGVYFFLAKSHDKIYSLKFIKP